MLTVLLWKFKLIGEQVLDAVNSEKTIILGTLKLVFFYGNPVTCFTCTLHL